MAIDASLSLLSSYIGTWASFIPAEFQRDPLDRGNRSPGDHFRQFDLYVNRMSDREKRLYASLGVPPPLIKRIQGGNPSLKTSFNASPQSYPWLANGGFQSMTIEEILFVEGALGLVRRKRAVWKSGLASMGHHVKVAGLSDLVAAVQGVFDQRTRLAHHVARIASVDTRVASYFDPSLRGTLGIQGLEKSLQTFLTPSWPPNK